jgi:hypothetical protein
MDKIVWCFISVDGSGDFPRSLFSRNPSVRFPIMLEILIWILSGHGFCITKYAIMFLFGLQFWYWLFNMPLFEFSRLQSGKGNIYRIYWTGLVKLVAVMPMVQMAWNSEIHLFTSILEAWQPLADTRLS